MRRAYVLLLFLAACGGPRPDGLLWKHHTRIHLLPRAAILDESYTPVMHGDVVLYLAGHGFPYKDKLQALRLRDGKLLWKQRVGWCFQNVVVTGSTAFTVCTVHEETYHERVTAVDIPSGRVLWTRRLEKNFRASNPVALDGRLYFTDVANLYSLDARTGSVDTARVPGAIGRDAVWLNADGPELLLGYNTHVYVVTRKNRFAITEKVTLDNHMGAGWAFHTMVKDGALYASGDHGTTKFDLTDGRKRWHRLSAYLPVVVNGVAYLSDRGDATAVSDSTGKVIWRKRTWGGRETFYDKGRVYVVDDKEIVALDAVNGREIKRWQAGAEILHGPMVIGNVLLYGNALAQLFAVKL